MRSVKICYEEEIDRFVEFMKNSERYKSEGKSHDAYFYGYHIYLYEGEENGGGLIHIDKTNDNLQEVYVIEGFTYSGCGEWESWQLEGIVFSTKEKALNYINKNSRANIRYEVKKTILR